MKRMSRGSKCASPEANKQESMQAELERFARHTRHTPEELESQRNLLARKYIALHVAGPEACAHVANDYHWLAVGPRAPELGGYREHLLADGEALAEMMRDGWPRNEPVDRNDPDLASLGAFCDALFPVGEHEEPWMQHQRDDHWQQRAAFVLAHRLDHPLTRQAFGTVLGGEETMQQKLRVQDAWDRVKSYVQEVGMHTTPREWGKFLGGLRELGAVVPVSVEQEIGEEEADEPEQVNAVAVVPIAAAPVVLDSEAPQSRPLEEWAAEPLVREWRLEQAMSPAVPPTRLLREYVGAQPESELAARLLADYASASAVREALTEHLEPGVTYAPSEAVLQERSVPGRARLAALVFENEN